MTRSGALRDLGSDARFALRMMRRQPVYAVASTLTAARAFEYIESIEPRTLALTGIGDPEVIQGGLASSGIFRMLGVEPKLGRTYTADEEQAGAAVVVLSDGLWRQRFNAEPSALGRTLTLDGRTFEIVGVMPVGFRALFEGSDLWVPLRPVVDPNRAGVRVMSTAGRLRPGVSVAPRVLAGAVILLSAVSMAVVDAQARRLASVSPVLALREDTSSH